MIIFRPRSFRASDKKMFQDPEPPINLYTDAMCQINETFTTSPPIIALVSLVV